MLKALMAFALIVGSAVAPVVVAPADAQRREIVRERTVVRTVPDRRYRDRRVYRNDRGFRNDRRFRGDRGYRGNRGWASRRVCDRQWRGGRRVTVCRTVRYRR